MGYNTGAFVASFVINATLKYTWDSNTGLCWKSYGDASGKAGVVSHPGESLLF